MRMYKVSNVSDIILAFDEISGFITCIYENKWWMACVLEKYENNREVKVSFLHPPGPHKSFTYPTKPDILRIASEDVLIKVDPLTETGRIYSLTDEENYLSSRELRRKIV